MKNRLSLLVSVIILVLVAGGIFAFVHFHKKAEKEVPQQTPPQAQTNTNVFSKPVFAPSGKLIDSFPANLVLDKSATANKSYDSIYNNNKQSTTTLSSKESPKAAHDQYLKYLTDNHYKVINDVSVLKTSSYALYGTSPSADISVSIQPQDKGSLITINYINK